jgi:hypothetical protein
MEVTMFRNFTILSLVLLFSFSLFSQDKVAQKKLSLGKTLTTHSMMKSGAGQKDKLETLFPVLPSSNSYAGGNYACWAPTCYRKYERCVYLISAAEIHALGIPSGVAVNEILWTYYYNGGGTTNAAGTMKIYLQNTTDLTFNKSTSWATIISPMTLVDNNAAWTFPTADYSKDEVFSLPTAFTYTGGGIYVAFDLQNNSGVSTTYFQSPNITDVIPGTNTIACEYGQSASTVPATLGSTNGMYRAETYLGFNVANDLSVDQIYTYGKLPVPYATPHQIIAAVGNNGNSTKTNFNVTLNITGANTYSETVNVASLQNGYYTDITFSNWTPANQGTNTITVSVPADDINLNNTKTVTQLITYNTYTYAYGPFPPTPDGGVGFTGTTGDFVAKFHSASASSVNQIVVNFDVGGQPFNVGIWNANGTGGIPGTLLWQSASLTSTAGVFTVPVSPAVAVSGDFYVGVRQTGTANVSFAYQVESPVRSSTFYFTSPTGGTTWNDFAPGNDFRFMIEPRLAIANDVGVSAIGNPVGGSIHHMNEGSFVPTATVSNYGFNAQTSLSVTMTIRDASNAVVYTNTKSIASIASGVSTPVTFDPTSFTPTAQTYTASCTTNLAADADHTNDLVSASFTYSYWTLDLGALVEAMWVAGNGTQMISAPLITAELHDGTTFALVESKTATLSVDGVASFNFVTPIDATPYYIVVKSPTTLETWSATAVSFTNRSLSYDFASAVTQAYTDGSLAPLALHGSWYCIYSGDVNHDGFITNDDFTGVDNDASVGDWHVENDVNGDGFVTNDDFTFIDNNASVGLARQVPPGAPSHLATRPVKNHVQRSSVN